MSSSTPSLSDSRRAIATQGSSGDGRPSLLSRLASGVTSLWRPEQLRAWSRRYRGRRGVKAWLVRQLEAFVMALRRALRQDILNQASALTYNTLLGLVPLLAVAFALFQAFGGLQRFRAPLNQFILENLAAGSAAQVGQWLDRFIAKINAGAIAGVSVLFLFWAAVGLLTTIEGALNRIWGVQRGRSLLTRIIMYWGILTLTPPLLAVSLSATAQLRRASFTTTLLGLLPLGLGRWVLNLAGAVAVSLAFVLLYVILPNTKVRLRAALIGGLAAGLIWSLLKALFVTVIAGSVSYSLIYGTLGLLPILMLWLWISWIVVLFGAFLTAANQSLHTEGLELSRLEMSQWFRERLAARLCVAVAAAFHRGEPPLSEQKLAEQVGTVAAVVRQVLDVLTGHGILAEVRLAGGETGFLPGRDTHVLGLAEVVDVLRREEGGRLELSGEPVGDQAVEVLERAEAASREQLRGLSLRDLSLQAAGPGREPG